MYSFLIFEDDPVDAEILDSAFSHHFNNHDTQITNEKGDVGSILSSQKFNCIFVDYNLGQKKGSEIVKKIRAINDILPIIMVTGQGSENVAVDSFRAGVTDYLIKGDELSPFFKKSVENLVDSYHAKNILRHQREEMSFLFKSLTHDLQEPVKKILMFSHLLDSDDLSRDEEEQILEMLNLSANDIEAVFKALRLYINTLSNSGFEQSFIDFDEALKDTINDYGPYFETVGIKLSYQKNIPKIYTYPDVFNVMIKTIIQHVVKEYSVDNIKSSIYLFYEFKDNHHCLCLKRLKDELPGKITRKVYDQLEHNIAFQLCRKIITTVGGRFEFNEEEEVKYLSFSLPTIEDMEKFKK